MLSISTCIVQKWITGHGTFQQSLTEHHFKAYFLLNKCIGWAKTNVSLMWQRPMGKKNASEQFPWNFLWMVFITFRSLFLPGFLWLIWICNCRAEIKTGHWNKKNWNMKIGIRISIYLFLESWKLVSKLKFRFFFVDWKLKFDSSFAIFWRLKINFRFSKS